ncbi:MAG TPA: hypothetical protein PLE30_05160 [Candidatus Kapabacteria bacterium]|nr:hypothetical protein [Candidatus Kapabacteria bacterium]
MKSYTIILYLFFIYLLSSCSSLTRQEEDILTISEIDTTITYQVQNSPTNIDNGIIFPSSRVIKKERELIQRDSTIVRSYPNFIRAGLFESIGTIGGNSDFGIGTGLFGVMPDLINLSKAYRGDKSKLFTGGIYRVGIFEWKLNIFNESPNWTYGVNALEFILPDARGEQMLVGLSPLYIKKRFFLREEIPYISISPSIGFSLYPSIYTNIATSLDIGSLGGFNIRAYLGIALGYNPSYAPQIKNNDFATNGQSVVHPYFGIGASYLDFLNRDEDLAIEWKYYKHSSWNIGLLQLAYLSSNSDKSAFSTSDTSNALIKGFQLKIANANIALPIMNYKVFAGTSLISLFVAGQHEYALSILPIRIGYFYTIIPKELNLEPFLELGYFPMYSVNLGGKLSLRLNEIFNISINAGYISGSQELNLGKDIIENWGLSQDFSRFYIGVSFNIYERMFDKSELRYFK